MSDTLASAPRNASPSLTFILTDRETLDERMSTALTKSSSSSTDGGLDPDGMV